MERKKEKVTCKCRVGVEAKNRKPIKMYKMQRNVGRFYKENKNPATGSLQGAVTHSNHIKGLFRSTASGQ